MDGVFTGGRNVDEQLHRNPDVNLGGALFALPLPRPLLHGLPALTTLGPLAVEPHVETVVFRTGGEVAGPEVVATGLAELHGVGKNRKFAGLTGKIFPVHQ